MRPCNAFSLSQAIGIPRETIRRKIDELVKRGWVHRHPQGGYIVDSKISSQFADNLNVTILEGLLNLSDEIRAILERPSTRQRD
jgi:DNA-binding GntR family transcriptional regulator